MSDETATQLQALSDRLGRIETALAKLTDRQEILDCLTRYSRGLDRHDEEMIASAFHEDALDHHGDFIGDPRELAVWGNALHAQSFDAHQHFLTTHTADIDGDSAHTETYWLAVLRRKENGRSVMIGGRYVDRLERRDGVWKIVVRRTVMESIAEGERPEFARWQYYVKGTWDHDDISFVRPLTLDLPRNVPTVGGKVVVES
ncbi:MAG TPA: nuclear transport factor 2 family protein [Solirubrobacteraceae bacterium]|nr:nuclear transport factor 2 family protein [Solirubrobacteraceae bacterium]